MRSNKQRRKLCVLGILANSQTLETWDPQNRKCQIFLHGEELPLLKKYVLKTYGPGIQQGEDTGLGTLGAVVHTQVRDPECEKQRRYLDALKRVF